jgi:hypothetical protein
MKIIVSAAVAVVILYLVDELSNDGRFTRAAIVVLRNVAVAIGIHF